jgi:glycosyltransferase involved in cell wall biosynthesis
MEYAFGQTGGQEAVFRILADAIRSEFDLVVVTNDTAESWAKAGFEGSGIRHICWEPHKLSRIRSRGLAQTLLHEKVQLAHFHFGATFSWGNRWFGRCPIHQVARRGIACLSTVHSVHIPLEGYIGNHRPFWVKLCLFPFAWGAKCYTLSRTAIEFAVSRHDLDILRSCCGPLGPKQRLLYHSTVREGSLLPGNEPRQPFILCVGNIGRRKGQAVLVKAFSLVTKRFPEWKLILVGRWEQDPYIDEVRAAIESSPSPQKIEVRGALPPASVHELMRTSALFAMPSLEEGLGLALQEALLSGCPAVASRTGGIPELIDDGINGLLVVPGDPQALARGLAELMEAPERRRTLAAETHASVVRKGMTLERMVENYLTAYRELLGQTIVATPKT